MADTAARTVESFWGNTEVTVLAQGDFLRQCSVPIVSPDFAANVGQATPMKVQVVVLDLIVMTQSCDLENGKAPLVACCPINSLARFEETNEKFKQPKAWESVRQGRQEGLHLLGSLANPGDKWDAYVVDFRSIYSLPIAYLTTHARTLGPRGRLRSPFLEHFSQSFARFFMRVGLPGGNFSYNDEPLRPPAPFVPTD